MAWDRCDVRDGRGGSNPGHGLWGAPDKAGMEAVHGKGPDGVRGAGEGRHNWIDEG